MRSFISIVLSLLVAAAAFATASSPFFHLELTNKDGKIHVVGKNTSHSPLMAYVVVAERGHMRTVWKGNYTQDSALGVDKTVNVGELALESTSEQAHVSVDYVRFADGTAWGVAATDEAKAIAASYQK